MDVEPAVEDHLSVWGLEPTKQNLAKVLPPRSHAGRDGEEKMRWSPAEGFVSLNGVDLQIHVSQVSEKSLPETIHGTTRTGVKYDRLVFTLEVRNFLPKSHVSSSIFHSGGLEDTIYGPDWKGW